MLLLRVLLILSLILPFSVGCGRDESQRFSQTAKGKRTMLEDERTAKLQRIFKLPATVNTADEVQTYLSSRWDHFVKQGPLAYQPNRRSFVEQPWPGKPLNLYAGLYPNSTATNLLDYRVFVRYTSSIQQDLIATGKVNLAYHIPEEKDVAIKKLLQDVETCEHLNNHDAIVTRLRELKILSKVDWLMRLEYKSATVSAGDDGIEISAQAKEGFVTIFAVDG